MWILRYTELFDGIKSEMVQDSIIAHELGHAWAYMEYGVEAVRVDLFLGEKNSLRGLATPVSPAEIYMTRREHCTTLIAGAVFQMLWLYDQGARLKSGRRFRDFWYGMDGLKSDRDRFVLEVGGSISDIDSLVRICYADAKEMYISAGGSQWVAQMCSGLVPTLSGYTLTIVDPVPAAVA